MPYFDQCSSTPAFVSVHLDCTIDPATRRLGVEVTGERGALLDLFYPGQNLSVWLVEDGVETKEKTFFNFFNRNIKISCVIC